MALSAITAYLLIAGRAGGEVGLKVVELLEEVLLGEVAVLLGPNVTVVLQHADDLQVLDLTGQLLDLFLDGRRRNERRGHFFDG